MDVKDFVDNGYKGLQLPMGAGDWESRLFIDFLMEYIDENPMQVEEAAHRFLMGRAEYICEREAV